MKYIKPIVLSAAVIGIAAIIAVVVLIRTDSPLLGGNGSARSKVLVNQAALSSLTKKDASSADVTRINADIVPPTNSWISGMVLQETPLPVFPMPLTFLAKDTGFEIGLPKVTSTPDIIAGGHTPGAMATIDGADGFMLERFDKVSATLAYSDDDRTLGNLTLAQGSPYVFYRALDESKLTINGMGPVVTKSSTYVRYTKDGKDYAVVANDGATLAVKDATASIQAPKGSLVTTYALPSDGDDKLKDLAANELQSVDVTIGETGSNATTALEYKTANNQPTVFAAMSYTDVANKGTAISTYDSVYGPMEAVKGSKLTFTAPAVKPSSALDLSVLTEDHKEILIQDLKKDVASTTVVAEDSYFAGKQLARAATLLDIAEQLEQTESSEALKKILREEFKKRLGPDYFYYDTKLKGVAAQTKAFGSEDFNDHHFHYGYFIYAASIFGRYDETFLKENQTQIDLLVADIASYDETDDFPIQRTYDPYSAHSWAAGLSPFADGNNQESSSEALNAWNGVALWGELTDNVQLESTGEWMLANESATAATAWRQVDTDAPYLKDYTSPIASLSFGGKRTYSTFFSDESNAKFGIQLLPLSPTMLSLKRDGENVKKLVSSSIKNDNFNVALGDYILMYLALGDSQKAISLLDKQESKFIDDGNSETYMRAWVYSIHDR